MSKTQIHTYGCGLGRWKINDMLFYVFCSIFPLLFFLARRRDARELVRFNFQVMLTCVLSFRREFHSIEHNERLESLDRVAIFHIGCDK